MRRIMKSRCTPQHNLLTEIGGTTRRRWGDASIHRYRSKLQAKKGRKVTSTGSRGDLYWSLRQPILRLLRQSPALYLLC